MNIGVALKQERIKLNLNQSQMAGNVLTKSFYSKVERNLCSIRAEDLLSILSLHNIDYSSFFKKLELEHDNSNKLSEVECTNLLHAAYYQNDLSKVLKVQELLKQRDTSKINVNSINAQIIIIKAAISNTLDKISPKEKEYIKRTIFETDNWTENSLRLFAISMFIFDTDDMNSVLTIILNNIQDINSISEDTQKIFSAILINYLLELFTYLLQANSKKQCVSIYR